MTQPLPDHSDYWNKLGKGTPFEGLGHVLSDVPPPIATEYKDKLFVVSGTDEVTTFNGTRVKFDPSPDQHKDTLPTVEDIVDGYVSNEIRNAALPTKVTRVMAYEVIEKEAKAAIEARDAEIERKARVDEVDRIPNPAWVGSDGRRINPNERYKANRKAELEAQIKGENPTT